MAAGLKSAHGEGLPPFTADGLSLSGVQAAEAQAPAPVPAAKAVSVLPDFSLKNSVHKDQVDDKGKLICGDSYSNDYSRSVDYRRWSAFLKDGARPPKDVDGEWDMVGAMTFSYQECEVRAGWFGGRKHKYCLASDFVSSPEGLASLQRLDSVDAVHKMRLEFFDRGASGSLMCYWGPCDEETYRLHPADEPYAVGPDLVQIGNWKWRCRLFGNDDSHLVCGVTKEGSDQIDLFLVYARGEGADSLGAVGPLLKQFVPSAPAIRMTKSRPKN